MRRTFIISLLFIFFSALVSLQAQDVKIEPKDSTVLEKPIVPTDLKQLSDSLASTTKNITKPADLTIESAVKKTLKPVVEFKPNPTKAVIYSAVFPGLGQFYNRKYWKLPIVYGGFLGLTYAISWNGGKYNDYDHAYRDVMNGGTDWKSMIPNVVNPEANKEYWTSRFKSQRDFFRRNRDLAIICAVGVYALCMIDAYVDAHLYGFDISPDLSMHVTPVLWGPNAHSKASIGLQCNINF